MRLPQRGIAERGNSHCTTTRAACPGHLCAHIRAYSRWRNRESVDADNAGCSVFMCAHDTRDGVCRRIEVREVRVDTTRALSFFERKVAQGEPGVGRAIPDRGDGRRHSEQNIFNQFLDDKAHRDRAPRLERVELCGLERYKVLLAIGTVLGLEACTGLWRDQLVQLGRVSAIAFSV